MLPPIIKILWMRHLVSDRLILTLPLWVSLSCWVWLTIWHSTWNLLTSQYTNIFLGLRPRWWCLTWSVELSSWTRWSILWICSTNCWSMSCGPAWNSNLDSLWWSKIILRNLLIISFYYQIMLLWDIGILKSYIL